MGKNIRVLMVDDEKRFRATTKKILTKKGFEAILADSGEAHSCFVEQLFHNLVKQPVSAYGPRQLENLEAAFAAGDFSIQKLMVEIMKSTALKTN